MELKEYLEQELKQLGYKLESTNICELEKILGINSFIFFPLIFSSLVKSGISYSILFIKLL